MECTKCKKETFVIYICDEGKLCSECYDEATEERKKNGKVKESVDIRDCNDKLHNIQGDKDDWLIV